MTVDSADFAALVVIVVVLAITFLCGIAYGVQLAESAFDTAFPELQGRKYRRHR